MSTNDAPTSTHYELPTGAIAVLEELLPTAQWYKDDPKYAKLLCTAVDALDALPETAPRPVPEKDETVAAYEARIAPWNDKVLMFDWTDKQRDAARKCIQHYLKLGQLNGATTSTVALIRLFKLHIDD